MCKSLLYQNHHPLAKLSATNFAMWVLSYYNHDERGMRLPSEKGRTTKQKKRNPTREYLSCSAHLHGVSRRRWKTIQPDKPQSEFTDYRLTIVYRLYLLPCTAYWWLSTFWTRRHRESWRLEYIVPQLRVGDETGCLRQAVRHTPVNVVIRRQKRPADIRDREVHWVALTSCEIIFYDFRTAMTGACSPVVSIRTRRVSNLSGIPR